MVRVVFETQPVVVFEWLDGLDSVQSYLIYRRENQTKEKKLMFNKTCLEIEKRITKKAIG